MKTSQQPWSDREGHGLGLTRGLDFNFSFSLTSSWLKCHIKFGRRAFALLEPPAGFVTTNACVCVCTGWDKRRQGLAAGINLFSLRAPNYSYHCSLGHATSDAKQKQKSVPGTLYTFHNKVEIASPRIDIGKTPQAGKDLDRILCFKSVNPITK